MNFSKNSAEKTKKNLIFNSSILSSYLKRLAIELAKHKWPEILQVKVLSGTLTYQYPPRNPPQIDREFSRVRQNNVKHEGDRDKSRRKLVVTPQIRRISKEFEAEGKIDPPSRYFILRFQKEFLKELCRESKQKRQFQLINSQQISQKTSNSASKARMGLEIASESTFGHPHLSISPSESSPD